MTPKEIVMASYPNSFIMEKGETEDDPYKYKINTGSPEFSDFTFLGAVSEEDAWELAAKVIQNLMIWQLEK